MVTADSVKAKMQGLLDAANAKTGSNSTTLSAAMAILTEGYGTGEDVPKTILPLEVSENGVYTAPDGVDGYSPVTVNVQHTCALLYDGIVTLDADITGTTAGTGSATVAQLPELAGIEQYMAVITKVTPVLDNGATEIVQATRNNSYNAQAIRWTGTGYSGNHYAKEYLGISDEGNVTVGTNNAAALPWLAGEYRLVVLA